MEFKQYPSYKNSGVEWLGDVPEHWYIFKSNKIFKQSNVRSYESDEQLTASQKYGVIPQSLYMKKEESKVVLALSGIDNFKHVDKNDFVISLRSFQGGIELCFYDGCVSPAYTVLKPNKVINYSFWSYLFKSTIYISVLNTAVDGIREGKTISYTNFGKIYINIPPLSEQAQIANYLDTETARIDNLISKQEKLIELLEEQRKSIISHAVTKGLNPNAPMKDSGVEWLGDVPEHWEVTFIKYITKKISSGKTPLGGAEVYTDEGVIFLRSQNIYNDGLHLDDVSFIPHEIHASMKSSAVKKNDVLLNITGGSIGRTCLVDCEIGEANVNQHVCIIRTSKDKYAKWLSVFMKSNSAQSQIFYSQTGAGREGLNFSQIGNMRLLFPPFVEQQEILDFLDQENLRFDNLILKQQSLIEKMKEYRASIISHAVTGKIDVREFGT